MVMKQLPPRTTEIVRIAPRQEQLDIHETNIKIVAQIVRKPFISEMDLLRMQKALLICRGTRPSSNSASAAPIAWDRSVRSRCI